VQALLYLATPFIAFPYALLSRAMDFRRQAAVNLLSAVLGALAALGGALGGLGVWTLVLAPMVLFGTRAIGMMVAARAWVRPSFDFRGAGGIARYGVLMATSQLFWVIQSQADALRESSLRLTTVRARPPRPRAPSARKTSKRSRPGAPGAK